MFLRTIDVIVPRSYITELRFQKKERKKKRKMVDINIAVEACARVRAHMHARTHAPNAELLE